MQRFGGLIRDTWWMWSIILVAGTLLAVFVHFIFAVTFPISLFSFIYFGLMRYDEEGNPREGL